VLGATVLNEIIGSNNVPPSTVREIALVEVIVIELGLP
jgi:hypothetical protein